LIASLGGVDCVHRSPKKLKWRRAKPYFAEAS